MRHTGTRVVGTGSGGGLRRSEVPAPLLHEHAALAEKIPSGIRLLHGGPNPMGKAELLHRMVGLDALVRPCAKCRAAAVNGHPTAEAVGTNNLHHRRLAHGRPTLLRRGEHEPRTVIECTSAGKDVVP